MTYDMGMILFFIGVLMAFLTGVYAIIFAILKKIWISIALIPAGLGIGALAAYFLYRAADISHKRMEMINGRKMESMAGLGPLMFLALLILFFLIVSFVVIIIDIRTLYLRRKMRNMS